MPSDSFDEPLRIGDRVRVTTGPFKGSPAIVSRLDPLIPIATVEIEVFGKPAPLDLLIADLDRDDL